ncbi:MAG: phosphate ABC transporter ATP-binding protein PstB [Candidatus Nitrosocaldaceae archaeon]
MLNDLMIERELDNKDYDTKITLECKDLSVAYGTKYGIKDINLKIPRNTVTAIIGPSGCGKSTLIRCFNRMNDLVDAKIEGKILFNGRDIYAKDVNVAEIRRTIGMVFQKPNPFPMSIYNNIAFGLKINGFKGDMKKQVEWALREAALWDEVKDRLNDNAYNLSGGQQQRLCIARALAVKPEVLLMDEPTASLDPIASSKIEELIRESRERYTIIIVTHNMQQAARVSDYTAFMYLGKLVEFDITKKIFSNPSEKLTEDYISGRFG